MRIGVFGLQGSSDGVQLNDYEVQRKLEVATEYDIRALGHEGASIYSRK
jgi:hypothetical protein